MSDSSEVSVPHHYLSQHTSLAATTSAYPEMRHTVYTKAKPVDRPGHLQLSGYLSRSHM